jgi:hypothetical protein
MVAALRAGSASVNADMNTDPQAIRDQVEAVLADLPRLDQEGPDTGGTGQAADIDAIGRRLEEAHQILVDALESVEKG